MLVDLLLSIRPLISISRHATSSFKLKVTTLSSISHSDTLCNMVCSLLLCLAHQHHSPCARTFERPKQVILIASAYLIWNFSAARRMGICQRRASCCRVLLAGHQTPLYCNMRASLRKIHSQIALHAPYMSKGTGFGTTERDVLGLRGIDLECRSITILSSSPYPTLSVL